MGRTEGRRAWKTISNMGTAHGLLDRKWQVPRKKKELNQAAVRVMIVQKVLIFMFLGSEHTRAPSRRGRGIAPAPIFPKVLDYFPPYPPGGSRS